MTTPQIPLVRLNLIRPFIDELVTRGKDPSAILEPRKWMAEALDKGDAWVAAQAIYDAVEDIAILAEDPYFGARLGSSSRMRAWVPFLHAVDRSRSVGDLFAKRTMGVRRHATSISYSLTVNRELARFESRREFQPTTAPAQIDAFAIGHCVSIFRKILGDEFDETRIGARVCDPSVISSDLLPTFCVSATGKRGFAITFPSEWLLLPTEKLARASTGPEIVKGPGLGVPDIEAITGSLIEAELNSPNFSIEAAAEFLGLSRKNLQLALREAGTSYGELRHGILKRRAIEEITHGDKPFGVIASDLGYTRAGNFTRAFREWTSLTPSDYRRKHSQGEPES